MFRKLHIPHGVIVVLEQDLFLDSLSADDSQALWGGNGPVLSTNGYRCLVNCDDECNPLRGRWAWWGDYFRTIALCFGASTLQPGQKIVYPSLEVL